MDNEDQTKLLSPRIEVMLLKGLAEHILGMSMPSIQEVNKYLVEIGYNIMPTEKNQNC
jgi:hypothetical protein